MVRRDSVLCHRHTDSRRDRLGGWHIAGRAPNKVCIWVLFNDQDQAAERNIIKDVVPKPPVWVDMSRYVGDPRDLASRVPMEYLIHKRLCETDGERYFVNIRAFRSFGERLMYRMIFQYCDQSDAEDMLRNFDHNSGRQVPELLVWRIFEHLVSAATVMEQGSLFGTKDDWLQVVHRDLEPDNFFMNSDPECYYAKPLLSDFGKSPAVRRAFEAAH